MSLINDALKRARQAPPRNTPNSLPPLQPVRAGSSPVGVWLIPAVVIILIVAAIFFLGWAMARHTIHSIVTAPDPTAATQQVADVTLPAIAPAPAPPAPGSSAPPSPPDMPRLQGIFYSATDPTAILDGKNVRPGDHFQQFRVKEITKYTVILTGPDGKDINLGMGD
jgi:hypothetical protein